VAKGSNIVERPYLVDELEDDEIAKGPLEDLTCRARSGLFREDFRYLGRWIG